MCGIVGMTGYNQRLMPLMIDLLYERGPDDNSTFPIGPYGQFGHTRLSIIDLTDRGTQPMRSRRYVLTYNGEIYNYRELKQYISVNDDLGVTNLYGNDAKTLLTYIEKFGLDKALADINGMYAFGLFDSQENKIHLVVDRFGQKPLYYVHDGDKFAFASAPAVLVPLRDKWKLNRQALDSYWMLGAVISEDSLFDGIKCVLPSHVVTFDLNTKELSTRRYWSPTFQNNTAGMEDLILDAINKVKVSDVPVHIFLSGGIDSTLIASQCEGMNAVHLESPEIEYAKEAARKFRIHLNQVSVNEIDVEDSLKRFAEVCGHPAMAALQPFIASKKVGWNAKVAISANGADELFFGYDRTQQHVTVQQNEHIFRNLPKLHDTLMPIIDAFDYDDERLSYGRWLELVSYVSFDLNKTLDFASMAHSLEVRCPFLDHRVVEMALSIREEAHITKRFGRKSILKNMLSKMGFSDEFLTRPKLGFSLHYQPKGMNALENTAWDFCIREKFLDVNPARLSGRDVRYLTASALSFYFWFQIWKNKLDL